MKALRATRDLTQRDLSRRLAQVGVTLSQSQIARIERGEAPVELDHTVAIAVVLDVLLDSLISPIGEYTKVQVTPSVTVDGADFAAWLHAPVNLRQLLAQMESAARDVVPAYAMERDRWAGEQIRSLVGNLTWAADRMVANPLIPLEQRQQLARLATQLRAAIQPSPPPAPGDPP